MKKCTKCNTLKSLSEFYKNKTREDGLGFYCKKCVRLYKIENKEIIDAKRATYYKVNKNKAKEYYLKNRVEKIAYCKEYQTKNKDKIKKYKKEYRTRNRDKHAEYMAVYQNDRRKNDVQFKTAHNLRARLNSAIKKNCKSGSAVKDLGLSIESFIRYFKPKFYPRSDGKLMSWDNYGEWHIDHIFPLSKFDLTDREQLLKACHYSNLQPLWAEDNLMKGGN